jgi:hypothetical protein
MNLKTQAVVPVDWEYWEFSIGEHDFVMEIGYDIMKLCIKSLQCSYFETKMDITYICLQFFLLCCIWKKMALLTNGVLENSCAQFDKDLCY